jgi:hypothetical protein
MVSGALRVTETVECCTIPRKEHDVDEENDAVTRTMASKTRSVWRVIRDEYDVVLCDIVSTAVRVTETVESWKNTM